MVEEHSYVSRGLSVVGLGSFYRDSMLCLITAVFNRYLSICPALAQDISAAMLPRHALACFRLAFFFVVNDSLVYTSRP